MELTTAVSELLELHTGNDWFIRQYWPENEERVEWIIADIQRCFPRGATIFDIGCGNGYISWLLARLGYRVTATDGWELSERDEAFRHIGVNFIYSNLNDPEPIRFLKGQNFDVILMGEVIEHILNCPVDLLRSSRALAAPNGLLILTTPNPSTLMNAWRVAQGTHSLWGTWDFASKPKIADGTLIDAGDIHYREYRTDELTRMIQAGGWTIEEIRYCPQGISGQQSIAKRFLKTVFPGLLHTRLLGSTQYITARTAP